MELLQWRLEGEQDGAQVVIEKYRRIETPAPNIMFITCSFKVAKMVSEAEELCKRLANELDVIRARYTIYKKVLKMGMLGRHQHTETNFVQLFLESFPKKSVFRYWTFIQNTISKKYGRSN